VWASGRSLFSGAYVRSVIHSLYGTQFSYTISFLRIATVGVDRVQPFLGPPLAQHGRRNSDAFLGCRCFCRYLWSKPGCFTVPSTLSISCSSAASKYVVGTVTVASRRMFDVRPGGSLPKRLASQGSSGFGLMKVHRTRDHIPLLWSPQCGSLTRFLI
jgi:hypothetical protein